MGQPQGLIAHVYPDETETKKMSPDVIREKIRKEVDKYNKKQPAYRRIIDVVMRDEPFQKTTTRKINLKLHLKSPLLQAAITVRFYKFAQA